MADILIKGMDLPKEGFNRLMIYPDGTVREINLYNEAVMPTNATAIELPEHHGRLIDESELVRIADEICRNPLGAILEDVSTIVEATE